LRQLGFLRVQKSAEKVSRSGVWSRSLDLARRAHREAITRPLARAGVGKTPFGFGVQLSRQRTFLQDHDIVAQVHRIRRGDDCGV
jgi:hypothetical protein